MKRGRQPSTHGWPRATKDIDICPAPSRENWTRLAQSLVDLEAQQEGDFDPAELPFDPTDPFCSLEDLRTMKESAGRPRDLDDLQHLPRPSNRKESR
ncbi:MAG: hypothetical protein MSC31_10675 [Solirubrobacteraceae bacterium MAG38_C4-C5]|nr:hypothetical protein [Candidatus Siliceabacter maunaloa]